MTENVETNRTNWIWVDKGDELLINLVCTHCGKVMSQHGYLIYGNDKLGISCEHCIKSFKGTNNHSVISTKEISSEVICDILSTNKLTIFIQGSSLYINFCLMVKNYRHKTRFCNY